MTFTRCLLVFAFGLTLSAPSRSEVSSCLDKKGTDAIASQFHFVYEHGAHYFRPCDKTNLAYQLMEALLYIRNLSFSGTPKDQFDQNLILPDPERFVEERLQTVVIDNKTQDCREQEAYYDDVKTVHFCKGASGLGVVMLSSDFIHEGKHHDDDGYPHESCKHGSQMGVPESCDKTYETKGAYAAETEYFIKLARSESVPESQRQEARSYAVSYLLDRFNEFPIAGRQGVVLQSNSGGVFFFDGVAAAPLFQNSHQLPLVLQDNSIALVGEHNIELKYLGGLHFENSDAFDVPNDSALLDLFDLGENAQCQLTQSFISCYDGVSTVTIPFLSFKADHFLTTGSDPLFKNRILVVSDQGKVFEYSWVRRRGRMVLSQPRQVPQPFGLYSLTKISAGRFFGLDGEGTLHEVLISKKGVSLQPRLEGHHFDRLKGPLIWSEMLNDL